MRTPARNRPLVPVATVVALVASAGVPNTALAQNPPRMACTLLPASVVAEMVGGEVETEEMGTACAYFLRPVDPDFPDPSLEIQVTWSGGAAKAREEVASAGDKLRPVAGLGDGAWVSRYVGQVSLLVEDDVLITFHMALMKGVPGNGLAWAPTMSGPAEAHSGSASISASRPRMASTLA